jgi:hypothetical protein
VLRVIIPDSHGSSIDKQAEAAFLSDLKKLNPDEIVLLGDHVDVSGIYSTHPNGYIADLEYSYESDIAACARFLDAIQKNAPRASIDYLEGNHENHVQRWISRTYLHAKDAKAVKGLIAPEAKLKLKSRGIRYYEMGEMHHGLSVRGVIKKGKCYFIHGLSAAKNATGVHLDKFGACVVHGHKHVAQATTKRTVVSDVIGAWCPGTLAQLTPLYLHTAPSDWSHGYAVQLVNKSGTFLHVQVPIVKGKSMLKPLIDRVK